MHNVLYLFLQKVYNSSLYRYPCCSIYFSRSFSTTLALFTNLCEADLAKSNSLHTFITEFRFLLKALKKRLLLNSYNISFSTSHCY